MLKKNHKLIRGKKSLRFLLLIIIGMVSINNNKVSTVENFNSRLLKDIIININYYRLSPFY